MCCEEWRNRAGVLVVMTHKPFHKQLRSCVGELASLTSSSSCASTHSATFHVVANIGQPRICIDAFVHLYRTLKQFQQRGRVYTYVTTSEMTFCGISPYQKSLNKKDFKKYNASDTKHFSSFIMGRSP